jgi:cytoskeletal protein CcmA (bactofilin family)
VFQRARATSVGDCVFATRPKFQKREPAPDEVCRIDGTVGGSLDYPTYELTIGATGRVTADVRARIVIVEGAVEGDIYANEAVVLLGTANVLGDIASPRVSIEEGATFNGHLKSL